MNGKFLLDTNIIIALFAEETSVKEHLEQAGHMRVFLEGEEVGNRQGRVAWLQHRLGQRGEVVELDRVEQANLKDVDVLVVLSREVDEFGTFAADLHPQGLLDMLNRIAKAIRCVREQGFERLLITADHGFLFLPSGVQPQTMEAPAAEDMQTAFCCRRKSAGMHGNESIQ